VECQQCQPKRRQPSELDTSVQPANSAQPDVWSQIVVLTLYKAEEVKVFGADLQKQEREKKGGRGCCAYLFAPNRKHLTKHSPNRMGQQQQQPCSRSSSNVGVGVVVAAALYSFSLPPLVQPFQVFTRLFFNSNTSPCPPRSRWISSLFFQPF